MIHDFMTAASLPLVLVGYFAASGWVFLKLVRFLARYL